MKKNLQNQLEKEITHNEKIYQENKTYKEELNNNKIILI